MAHSANHVTLTNNTEPSASPPFLINQTGTLSPRHLAHFVSPIDIFVCLLTVEN